MAKVADVKLTWSKSPSADITKVSVLVTIDGTTTTTDVGPEVESFMIVVPASKSGSFQIDTYNADGKASSSVYSFSVDSLELPLPATNLAHVITAIRDVDDTPPPDSPPATP